MRRSRVSMNWESCRRGLVGVAVTLALAAVSSAGATAPSAKPKKCSAGKVLVRVNGKPKCLAASTVRSGAPGSNISDMLIRATANRALWRRPGRKSVYKALGTSSTGVLAFDRALYGASRAVGAPFVPHDPGPTSAKREDETLGLEIPAPIKWLLDKAERRQGGSEAASGEQTKEAATTGKLLKPPGSATGEYFIEIKESFKGDPCPKKGGVVDGKVIYSVSRTGGLLEEAVVNVATVTLTFKATVNKAATITSYDLAGKLDSAQGGWNGAIDGKGLKPDRIATPGQLSGLRVSGATGLSATAQAQLAAAVQQALLRAKEDVDRWLKASEEIFKNRAKCTKVDGSNLGKLKPGETREIELDVRSIRGTRTDDEIEIKGRKGLEVINPTGKTKATDGKLKVKVRGTKGHFKTFAAAAQAYLLDVGSVSELGRGAGTLEIPRVANYRFTGRLRENDFIQFGHPSGQIEVDFHVCGDPFEDPWTGNATYVSEGDLLTFSSTWRFTAGAYSSPVDDFGNTVSFVSGALELDADPPLAHFQVRDHTGAILTPTLELTDYDGCPS